MIGRCGRQSMALGGAGHHRQQVGLHGAAAAAVRGLLEAQLEAWRVRYVLSVSGPLLSSLMTV